MTWLLVDRQGLSKHERRKAVAGIFAALIIFALIFSVGLGYYLFENQNSLLTSQAALGKQEAALQANQESLSLAVHNNTSGSHISLWVEAYNSGSVPATITAVFVTNKSNGNLLSLSSTSSKSPYLVGKPDLTVSLPLTINVGVNTSSMSGCAAGKGCNIWINSTAFSYTKPAIVSVKVLTSRGNVFSATYPPQPSNSTTTITNTITVPGTVTNIITNTRTATITNGTTVTLATTGNLGSGLGTGTNSLLLAMKACAGPGISGNSSAPFTTKCVPISFISTGREVILEANVTNLASIPLNVSVQFQWIETNGASVSRYSGSSCSASNQTPTELVTAGKYTFTCEFVASPGPYGGTVTFIGFAVATAPSLSITSAEATSNPIELGNPSSGLTGPWLQNYLYFDYASSQNNKWSPADVISSKANSKVIFQVKMTNTANDSLYILQYSYLQIARESQEMDIYIIKPVTTYTSSPTAYSCLPSASGPTGTNCIKVTQGDPVTLDFAACVPGAASFLWANTGGGDNGASPCTGGSVNTGGFSPPEGVVVFIVIVYSYEINGVWQTFSQSLPLQGMYIS